MRRFLTLATAALVMLSFMATSSFAVTLNFAGHYPEEHPSTQLLYQAAKDVQKQTDGRVKIKVFPADQLGDYTLLFQDIMRGSVDMGQVNLPSEYDIRLEAHCIPYIVKSYEDIPKVFSYDSNFSNIFKRILADKNIEFFGFNVIGLIGVGSKVEPKDPFIPTSDKGILIRVPPMKVFQISGKEMNFRTTTINWADIYSAMQTGVCDGWIGGTPDVNYLTFKDVQKYYIAYNNFVECNAFIMGKDAYQKLGADGPIVRDIFKKAAAESYAIAEQQDNYYLNKMEEAGLTVMRPTPEQAQVMSDFFHEKIWPQLYKLYGEELFTAVRKDLGEI
ncbi:TRAP transporter substrate-binding protein DctP [Halodesulfovibrio sp. MK-HDV]|uniref:TRAP transporter substrate-binding protein DctP n=1 Tax=unclassified Halodesulfovibrio TaxID=2644657 RepID=UPI00136F8504|nr:TRAP transporter substrate-binding protein DctP [Halodesulfovibrio sp. MK-HDV]KAF1077856.1 Solute-binding protein [Halodesulfovibrio sp. MK-HDV]